MTCHALLIFTHSVNSIYFDFFFFFFGNYKDASYPHFNLVSLRIVEGRHYHADCPTHQQKNLLHEMETLNLKK